MNNKVWVNNAGIDGHSTFGHLMLTKEYILKIRPRYILLMTGVNDVELDQPDEFDRMAEKKINTSSAKNFFKSLVNQTEIGQSFFNYYQLRVSYKKGLIHREINLKNLVENPLPDSIITNRVNKQLSFLVKYKARINNIVSLCIEAGITPILITQPSLFGNYTDSITNVAVGNKWSEKNPIGDNCQLMEKVLESYNDVLRSFDNKIPVIDLARLMPKNSTFFYDFTHATNAGAEKMAALLSIALPRIIDFKTTH